MRQGHIDEAIVALQAAIKLSPMSVQDRYTLARCHEAKLQIDKAVGVLQDLLRLEPGFGPAITLLAQLQGRAGREG